MVTAENAVEAIKAAADSEQEAAESDNEAEQRAGECCMQRLERCGKLHQAQRELMLKSQSVRRRSGLCEYGSRAVRTYDEF